MNHTARHYAGQNVPRYTSYPTAADFTPRVGAADHRAWLDKLGPERISVYLHVPYRREICLYCGCNTKMAVRDQVIDRYRRAPEAETAMVGNLTKNLPTVEGYAGVAEHPVFLAWTV